MVQEAEGQRPEQGAEIENLMGEGRRFPPDPAFAAQANATADAVRRGGRRTSRPSGRASRASG